jgi:enolase
MANSDIIVKVWAREVLNFRGNPTVETEVTLADGSKGCVSVPAGISAGANEVGEILDGDKKRYNGKGVLTAVRNVREIIGPAVTGMHAAPQEAVDKKILAVEGTPNKSRLGGNAVLSVSLATALAAAASQKVPLFRYMGNNGDFRLPVPCFDLFCGGSHAKNSIDFQEILMIPAGLKTFGEALMSGNAVHQALGDILKKKGYEVGNTSGPLSAPLKTNRESIDIMAEAITKAGYKLGDECYIGIDAATSELYDSAIGKYVLKSEKKSLTASELADLWEDWVKSYPIVNIEDPMSEEDWDNWVMVTKRLGNRVQLVGDDFFTSSPARVKRGIEVGAANAVLIKPNQIGTLTETLETIKLAAAAGYRCQPSSRSGETEQMVISDIAVLPECGQIKCGPPSQQSIPKYNRLLRIQEELGDKAVYAGKSAFKYLK